MIVRLLQRERHPGLDFVYGSELALQFAANSGSRNHGAVIGAQAAFWNAEHDSVLVAVILQARTEPSVGTYAATDHESFHLGLFEGGDSLGHEAADNGVFQGGANVADVFLDKFRIVSFGVAKDCRL